MSNIEDEIQADTPSDETENESLPPFFDISGLNLNFWPTWAPLPNTKHFVPYFSVNVTSDSGEKSFVSTVDPSDLLSIIYRVSRVLRITIETAANIDGVKLDIGGNSKKILQQFQLISDNLEKITEAIRQKDLLFHQENDSAEIAEES